MYTSIFIIIIMMVMVTDDKVLRDCEWVFFIPFGYIYTVVLMNVLEFKLISYSLLMCLKEKQSFE